VKITCEEAWPLVPGYLDGELSEAQASPLRAHLLDCPACREEAKRGKALRRWFDVEPAPVSVPAGFAARVARRAFAGDPGLLFPEPPAARSRRSLLPFLLVASAVAAALLFVLSIAIQRESLPESNGLDALDGNPPWLEAETSPAPAAGGAEWLRVEHEARR
jgi:anti-sigma factor RsiW